jgi:hypothetical protein
VGKLEPRRGAPAISNACANMELVRYHFVLGCLGSFNLVEITELAQFIAQIAFE